MPGTINTVNIVTGIPFYSVTFNNGTNTFTINGHDYTDIFSPNAILTALGGPPNGGYQIVLYSTFTGGNTVVTVASYSTGTSYPGPATFTTGTGTIIWFNNTGIPPSMFPLPTDLLAVYALTSPGVIVGGGSTSFKTIDGIGYQYNTIDRTPTNCWGVTF